MSKMDLAIGVDVGGSHIVSAAINISTGAIVEGTKFHSSVNNKASKEEIFKVWSAVINQSLTAAPAEVQGVGFAMPGAFNYKEGIAMFDGNEKYTDLYQVHVPTYLAPLLSDPHIPIRFINDATAFGVGVATFGKAKGTTRSISITLGTGFGSTYIDEGLPVTDREDVAPHGCFWHLPFKGKIADHYFSTRWFVNTYKERTGSDVPGVKEIADAADLNDPTARELFVEYGTGLGEFLLPWLIKFKPEILVMGGNVAKAARHFQPAMEDFLFQNQVKLNIAVSSLMEDAALFGSAALYQESFWQRIKDELPSI